MRVLQIVECKKLEEAYAKFQAGCAFPAYRDVCSTAVSAICLGQFLCANHS